VRIRPWIAADAVRCTTISCTYTTSHVWQMDARQDSEEIRVGFRLVRLPRELTLDAEQRPPASPTGATRRGQLWLVAEEVEVPPGEGDRPTAVGPGWSHAVRPSRGASAVQLGFPASSPGPLPSTAASSKSAPPMEGSPRGRRSDAPAAAPPPVPEGTPQARGTIVGYVAAYRRTGDPYAYLQSLAVDTAYRRRGIGTRLVSEVCRWAAEEGAGRLMADIGARNYPAMRLLQKAGFSFCGYNDRCYPKDEVAVFLSVGLR
jgi:ribosomal protein S18 acetylase RimI-like enzyme